MVILSLSSKSPQDFNFPLVDKEMASAVVEKALQAILLFDNGDRIDLEGSRGSLRLMSC